MTHQQALHGSHNYRIITGEEWSNSFLSKHLTIGGVKLANDSKEGNSIVYGIDNNAIFVYYSCIC